MSQGPAGCCQKGRTSFLERFAFGYNVSKEIVAFGNKKGLGMKRSEN
jgi:hypothetical protein